MAERPFFDDLEPLLSLGSAPDDQSGCDLSGFAAIVAVTYPAGLGQNLRARIVYRGPVRAPIAIPPPRTIATNAASDHGLRRPTTLSAISTS